MSDNRAIGVFDSGLGGLTVMKELTALLPAESIVYFGDTGRVPYGTKSVDTIKKYALQDEKFLLSKNVKLIVAACGTVSSVAGRDGEKLPVPFIEVVSHSVKAAVSATKNKKIGVLATAATIKSGAHKKQILKLLPDAEVYEAAGSLLVPLVEEGWTDENNTVTTEALKRYLEPLKQKGIDTLILGCTHFPVLKKAISNILGENVSLINMGSAAARAVKERLAVSNMLCSEDNKPFYEFFVSDKPNNFVTAASILLGKETDEESVTLTTVDGL